MSQNLVVQKYGGSSLNSPVRIKTIARKIAEYQRRQSRVIVIVSAMGQTTDTLLALAREITPAPPRRELDMLLTVGERISMALLSMALNDLGCPAISFTGSQSGIVTSVSHTQAAIEEIYADRIRDSLEDEKVVIVAGFQGVSREKEVTTLGRGGSDTTAVALASVLEADLCEIYSDVPGVFTADPRIVPEALRVEAINYDEMLELATLGAKVLHYRAADIARRNGIPLVLLSSFEEAAGTTIRKSRSHSMEDLSIKSISTHLHAVLINIRLKDDDPTTETIAALFGEYELKTILYQKSRHDSTTHISCIVDSRDGDRIDGFLDHLSGKSIHYDVKREVATVSIIGAGVACNPDVITRMEHSLKSAKIPIMLVGNSSLSVTCLIPSHACQKAVQILHESFFTKSKSD